jgi:hypothetical protein
MTRTSAVRIKTEDWMTVEDFSSIMKDYGIEYTVGVCPQLGYPVIWIKDFKAELFLLAKGDMQIETNLRLWLDDGTQEILINENNYKDYDCSKFYEVRTGKYDLETNEL